MTRTREITHDSDEVVFRYTGDGTRFARNVPARDLTGSDIARIAYVRDLAAIANEVGQPIDPEDPDKGVVTRPDPRDPSPDTVRAVLDDLAATADYEPVAAPKTKPADKPEQPESNPMPEQPADKPEG